MNSIEKNVAKGTIEETQIEAGFIVLKFQNDTKDTQCIVREIDNSFIQFHFCLKGSSKFNFNKGNYMLNITADNSLFILCFLTLTKFLIQRFHPIFFATSSLKE